VGLEWQAFEVNGIASRCLKNTTGLMALDSVNGFERRGSLEAPAKGILCHSADAIRPVREDRNDVRPLRPAYPAQPDRRSVLRPQLADAVFPVSTRVSRPENDDVALLDPVN
jgi:hypothetical protein